MDRRVAAAFALLLLLGAGALVHAAPTTRAVWWGPTEMASGWHLRVPVVVTNPDARDSFDATASFDLDLTQALLEGGWPSAAGATTPRPAFFQLDERSIRVVEYRSLGLDAVDDGLVVGEVAARAYLGSFSSSATYDNRTRPDVHVEWTAPGLLKAGASRYFMIYADTTSNGEKPAAKHAEKDAAPLDARYWVSRGTTLYGMASQIVVVGLHDNTSVLVSAYSFGKSRPIQFGEGISNPFTLQAGEYNVISISDEPLLLRLSASRPIIAGGMAGEPGPGGYGVSGVVPSVTGGPMGTEFILPPTSNAYTLVKPQGSARFSIDNGAEMSLTPGTPMWVMPEDNNVHRVRANSPIMVLGWPGRVAQSVFPSQFGAPFGSVLVGQPYMGYMGVPDSSGSTGTTSLPTDVPVPGGNKKCCTPEPPCSVGNLQLQNGGVALMTLGEKGYYRGSNLLTGGSTYPKDGEQVAERAGLVNATPLRFSSGPGDARSCPVLLFSTATPEDRTPNGEARLVALGGSATLPIAGAQGGANATRFTVVAPLHVIAPYDRTLVTIRDAKGATIVRGLNANDSYEVTGVSFNAPATITSNRPVIPVYGGQGAFFAGVDDTLAAKRLGPAQFRGYLVDLRPEEGQSLPLVGLASTGRPATFHLTVRNLAKDAVGNPVTDTILLNTTPIAGGWGVEVSPRTVTLRGGESADVQVTVRPPPDAREGSRLAMSVIATSSGLPTISASLPTTTIIRTSYGVEVAFDREGGPKTRTLTFDPGASQDVLVAIKNTAVVRDRFTLTASPLSTDWTSRFESSGNALAEVELEPGEVALVPVEIQAPAGVRSQSVVQVTATSQSSAAASGQVTATVRTRADLSIDLMYDNATVDVKPGANATFRVTFVNRANDSVGIRFGLTAQSPEGWGAPDAFVRGFSIREVAGIPPASELPINVTLAVPASALRGQRAVLHFNLETLPQVLGDPVARESLDLVVLASARHDLDPQPTGVMMTPDASGAVQAVLTLHNTGNGAEDLAVFPRELPSGFTTIFPGPLRLDVGDRGSLTVDMRLSPGTAPGTYPVALTVAGDDGHEVPWNFNVSVPLRRAVSFEPLSPLLGIQGATTAARVAVENVGNVPLALPPVLALPPGWSAEWLDRGGELAPGEAAILAVRITTPANAPPGNHQLRSAESWAVNGTLTWRVDTVILKPAVSVDGRSVTVTIGNDGTGDARNVTVQLLVDGREADRVVLQRVAAGDASIAVLAAPADASGNAEVRVSGPADAPSAEPIAVQLEAGKPVPLPSALVLLAVLGALATLRRRV